MSLPATCCTSTSRLRNHHHHSFEAFGFWWPKQHQRFTLVRKIWPESLPFLKDLELFSHLLGGESFWSFFWRRRWPMLHLSAISLMFFSLQRFKKSLSFPLILKSAHHLHFCTDQPGSVELMWVSSERLLEPNLFPLAPHINSNGICQITGLFLTCQGQLFASHTVKTLALDRSGQKSSIVA